MNIQNNLYLHGTTSPMIIFKSETTNKKREREEEIFQERKQEKEEEKMKKKTDFKKVLFKFKKGKKINKHKQFN